jgi:hypothetical protein
VAGGEVGVALVHGQSRRCRLLSAATHGRTARRRSRVGSGDLGAEGKWDLGEVVVVCGVPRPWFCLRTKEKDATSRAGAR